MGSDPIALPALRYLHAEWRGEANLAAVYTQPDRKSGRGMQLRANPIKQWSVHEGIPVHQPRRVDESVLTLLQSESIDLVLVMAYGKILPTSFLEAVPLGVYNLHASVLPRLRGASPIHTAVALGLETTGVSLMRVVRKMDAGPVADMETVAIDPQDTSPVLIGKLAQACVPLLRRTGKGLISGNLPFTEQDPSRVTYCRIIEKTDAHLDFHASAESLARRIRAFTPWPGSSVPHRGQELRILEAEAEPDMDGCGNPGKVSQTDSGALLISCGRGSLRVIRMQRPGGQALETAAFLRGYDLPDGTVLASRPMHPLESTSPFPHRKKDKAG